jgi:DNA repair exonuclease SbcCD ATPase subunit
MKLIATWYHNIWPFLDQQIGISFQSGAYLIKAPIWSGKSFLFFDGPMFWLYKSSDRPMLHRKAEQWAVQVLIESLGVYYLIVRNITKTKVGNDSVSSRLYTFNSDPTSPYEHILNHHATSLVEIFAHSMQEIVCSSNDEVQKLILDLLPPKSVLMASSMLMQESDNIFELTPGERIDVFKHLFGLIGIDDAKEMIASKKKEIVTKRSVLSDISQYERDFRSYLSDIVQWCKTLDNQFATEVARLPAVADLQQIYEKVQLTDFKRQQDDLDLTNLLRSSQSDRDALLQQQSVITYQVQQLSAAKTKIDQQTTKISQLTAQITTTNGALSRIDTAAITEYETAKISLLTALDTLKNSIDISLLTARNPSVVDIPTAYHHIQSLKQQWKHLREQLTSREQQIQQLRDQVTTYQQSLAQYAGQKSQLQQSAEQASKFRCEKIQEDCPYVQVIRGKTTQVIDIQLATIDTQIQQTQSYVESTDQHIQRLEQDQSLQQQLDMISEIFVHIDWKLIEQLFDQYQWLQLQLTQIENSISGLQSQQLQLKQYQQDLARDQALLTDAQSVLETLTQEYHQLQISSPSPQQDIPGQIKIVDAKIKQLEHLTSVHTKLVQLMQSIQSQLLQAKKLSEQEQMLSNLHTVYSKELMIVVLQDFLPSLQEAINVNLAQVVWYELQFDLVKKSSDKLELEIMIADQHGSRLVKSLSGWQKTVLKIARILAVASMLQSSFLCMDETINNLDSDSVASIAELLRQFVKQRNIPYYVVTHATQIQQMDIWDEVIEVGEVMKG